MLLLELLHAGVPEGAKLGLGLDAAVQDRGVVAGVGHHGVARAGDRPDGAEVGLVAGGENHRRLGAHPVGDLLLELGVKGDRPVEQPRAGEPGSVLLERIARALEDPLVPGKAEVVVRSEHDPLGTFHFHHRPGGAVEKPEVGEQVGLPGHPQLLFALVAVDLGEEVCWGGGHIAWRPWR